MVIVMVIRILMPFNECTCIHVWSYVPDTLQILTVGLRVGLHGLHSTVFATLCNNSGGNTECRF